jgi:hypothetical protein
MLGAFADLASAQGQPERAARLWGAAQALHQALGSPLVGIEWQGYERHLAVVREVMGEEAFAAAHATGYTLTVEQAVTYALDDKEE